MLLSSRVWERVMRNEPMSRRTEFLGGIPVQLGDDQLWAFPGPRELCANGAIVDPTLNRLIGAIADSEDAAEASRMELALAIYLLGLNYELTPDESYMLLGGRSPETRARLAGAFHDLALRHGEAIAARAAEAAPAPAACRRRFRFPLFGPARRPAAAAVRRAAS